MGTARSFAGLLPWCRLGCPVWLVWLVWLLWLGCLGTGASRGQATTVELAVRELAAEAPVVFVGEVAAVTRGPGYVDVRFRVETAVRGCRGKGYVLREWDGLWSGGDRYAVGQWRLMLLRARGSSGMSTPAGGTDGAVPVFQSGGVLRVDLRWIRTRVLRGLVAQAGGGAAPVGNPNPQPFTDWVGPVTPMPAGGPSAAAAEPSVAEVLGWLGG